MDLLLNGEPRTLPSGATVDDAVDAVAEDRAGVAVAVNEEVVPRSAWPTTTLNAADRVEILTAAQGG